MLADEEAHTMSPDWWHCSPQPVAAHCFPRPPAVPFRTITAIPMPHASHRSLTQQHLASLSPLGSLEAINAAHTNNGAAPDAVNEGCDTSRTSDSFESGTLLSDEIKNSPHNWSQREIKRIAQREVEQIIVVERDLSVESEAAVTMQRFVRGWRGRDAVRQLRKGVQCIADNGTTQPNVVLPNTIVGWRLLNGGDGGGLSDGDGGGLNGGGGGLNGGGLNGGGLNGGGGQLLTAVASPFYGLGGDSSDFELTVNKLSRAGDGQEVITVLS